MKLGIMQPYFFPYLGYFSLIRYTDYFIFFDTPQYIRKGWVNRNRILEVNGKNNYITVPVANAPRETSINKIHISEKSRWCESLKGKLTIYKRRAPYYKQVLEMVEEIEKENITLISELNKVAIEKVCNYLELPIQCKNYSEMNLKIDQVEGPDEWALKITKALGYETYVNLPGGMDFFDREKYRKNGIQLQFIKNNLTPYNQRMGTFEEGLSILDAMMFLSKEEVIQKIDDYLILE